MVLELRYYVVESQKGGKYQCFKKGIRTILNNEHDSLLHTYVHLLMHVPSDTIFIMKKKPCQ